MDVTSLERAAIDAICDYQRGELPRAHRRSLSAALADPSASRRENTVVGFYTDLVFDTSPLKGLRYPRPIMGPLIDIEGLGGRFEMSFLLWPAESRPASPWVLEGFDIGSSDPGVDLADRDLYSLQVGAVTWMQRTADGNFRAPLP